MDSKRSGRNRDVRKSARGTERFTTGSANCRLKIGVRESTHRWKSRTAVVVVGAVVVWAAVVGVVIVEVVVVGEVAVGRSSCASECSEKSGNRGDVGRSCREALRRLRLRGSGLAKKASGSGHITQHLIESA